jgi:uncharacterized protein (UPF0332 family)
MSEEPEDFLELAEKAMEDYRKGKEVEMSVRALFNRLYYAAFYSAKAALMSIGEKPKTHRGTSHLVFKILHHEKNEIDKGNRVAARRSGKTQGRSRLPG